MFKFSLFEKMVKMCLKGMGDSWIGNPENYEVVDFCNSFLRGIEEAKEKGFNGATVEVKFNKEDNNG